MAARRLELLPGEVVVVDTRPHWAYLFWPFVLALFAVSTGVVLDVAWPHSTPPVHWAEGIICGLLCLWFVGRFAKWIANHLVLTSLRLVQTWGLLRGHHFEVALARIEFLRRRQGILQRLVGAGRLEVGVWAEPEVFVFEDVRHVAAFQRLVHRRIPVTGIRSDEDGNW